MTQDEFLERCKKVHKGKFDYSLVVYKGVINKIKIICPVHGKFKQKAAGHLEGKGCLQCAKDERKHMVGCWYVDKQLKC
jgi:hypothetical protein